MRIYETREAADAAAVGGEFGCGTVVSVDGRKLQLTSLVGGVLPKWVALREASPIPPLRKFDTPADFCTWVRRDRPTPGTVAKVDDIEVTIAAHDDLDVVVVVVASGSQETWSLGRESKPAPVPDPEPSSRARTLPDDDAERKAIPLYSGCLLYFPAALVEVAKCSKRGNDQHVPGKPLHWARGKSMAQMESQLHHMLDAAESTGAERIEHLAAAAWRALAELQLECERQGAPLAPGAKDADRAD